MIQRIKDLMRIQELIDEINGKINSNNEVVNNLKNEINLLKEQLGEIKINQKEFLTNFKGNLDIIKNLREDFEEEVYRFKGLKEKTQKEIMKKFEEELQNELKLQMENLKKDFGHYEQIKKELSNITIKLNNFSEEITKFTNISNKIKEKDFEMEKFAKQLLETDNEKLNLMRKIDSLERLIARMRRVR